MSVVSTTGRARPTPTAGAGPDQASRYVSDSRRWPVIRGTRLGRYRVGSARASACRAAAILSVSRKAARIRNNEQGLGGAVRLGVMVDDQAKWQSVSKGPKDLNHQFVSSLPDDAPVVMVNLVRFRERSLDGNGTGWDAYSRYSKADMPLLKRVGGTILWAGPRRSERRGCRDRPRFRTWRDGCRSRACGSIHRSKRRRR